MFSVNRERQLDEELYKLKFQQKTLQKTALTYKKNEVAYYKKAKKALVKGDERTASTFARQSVQFSDMALATTNMACRLEVTESKLKTALQSGRINEQVIKTTCLLTAALMPVTTMSKLGAFDKAFEDIMVTSNGIADVLDAVAAPELGANDRENALLGMMQEEIAVDDMASLPLFSGASGSKTLASVISGNLIHTKNDF
jgi:hypothetical protein